MVIFFFENFFALINKRILKIKIHKLFIQIRTWLENGDENTM